MDDGCGGYVNGSEGGVSAENTAKNKKTYFNKSIDNKTLE